MNPWPSALYAAPLLARLWLQFVEHKLYGTVIRHVFDLFLKSHDIVQVMDDLFFFFEKTKLSREIFLNGKYEGARKVAACKL